MLTKFAFVLLFLLFSVASINACLSVNRCSKPELECDGKVDCPDGSDEFEEKCDLKLCRPPKFYKCKDDDKTCIADHFRCNGQNDCPQNDDEQDCNNNESAQLDEFDRSADNMCIQMDSKSDVGRNSTNGSNEFVICSNFMNKDRLSQGFKTSICKNVNQWKNCTTDNKKFLCEDNVMCLPIENACDRKEDCMDGSDEGGICEKFHNNTNCELDYCPVDAECFIWPNGPVCVCGKGFIYNAKKKICKVLTKSTQKLFPTEPILLYAEGTSIHEIGIRSYRTSIVSKTIRFAFGASRDSHYVYWANVELDKQSIQKSKLDGTQRETLMENGLSFVQDIAIDWVTGNLYFSDLEYRKIAVCTNDGKHCTSLITRNVDKPQSIALYPQEGRMYWSEWGSYRMIGVAQMDGSNVSPFISENVGRPTGLALDWGNGMIFWTDTELDRIESCYLDGTRRRIVIKSGLLYPYSLAVFENNIYWSDWDTMSVASCNKFSCESCLTIVENKKVYDLHVYHSSIQPMLPNPCQSHKCTHLCLLASNQTYKCGCPDGMKLNVDLVSCTAIVKRESIYIGWRNYLITIEHKSFGRHDVENLKVLPIYIHKMAFNLLNGHVFIADNIAKIIYDYELKNETTTELVNRNIYQISSMFFDHLANNLYWSDSQRGSIEILSLNTNRRSVFYQCSSIEKPISIAVLPEFGHMLMAVTSNLNQTHIYMLSLFGYGTRYQLNEIQVGNGSIHFNIDRKHHDVYWSDSASKKISYIGLRDYPSKEWKTLSGEPTSMATIEEDLFWTKKNVFGIYYASIKYPSITRQLDLPQSYLFSEEDELVLLSVQPTITVSHPCMINNGNCSHICLSRYSTQKACLCPGKISPIMEDTTCVDNVECEFRCGSGECIRAIRKCNHINDCVDASDERGCS